MITPATVDEARRYLADLHADGQRAAFLGAGTKSAPPEARGADVSTVSTLELNRVVDYAPADLTITVEAGHSFDALNNLVANDNLRLPLDPPGYDGHATIGGVLATGDSGPLRLSLGSPRDAVLGMTLITGDGRVIRCGGRVLKNVAGYGLHRLMVGSWGALALIASVTVRLRPRPEAMRLVAIPVADEAAAEARTTKLLTGPTRPAMIEWLRTRVPLLCEQCKSDVIVVGFEDSPEAVDWQVEQIARSVPTARALDASESAEAYARLREWGASATLRAALLPSHLADLFRAARDIDAELLAHVGGATLLAKTASDGALGQLIEIVERVGGNVIEPRAPAPSDHDDLRAGLARAFGRSMEYALA